MTKWVERKWFERKRGSEEEVTWIDVSYASTEQWVRDNTLAVIRGGLLVGC